MTIFLMAKTLSNVLVVDVRKEGFFGHRCIGLWSLLCSVDADVRCGMQDTVEDAGMRRELCWSASVVFLFSRYCEFCVECLYLLRLGCAW